jgi:hypothetical protein
MPRHEFGIMKMEPIKGIRFDVYEPEKYDCISINDIFIEPLLSELININFYWHSIDVPGKGLAYFGVTLIPPESLDLFINIIFDSSDLSLLKELLMKAKADQKFVIHFGI